MTRTKRLVTLEKRPSIDTKEVVELLSYGLKVSEIAERKKYNKRTLEAYIERIKVQYDCANIPQLVAFFLRNNLIK